MYIYIYIYIYIHIHRREAVERVSPLDSDIERERYSDIEREILFL